MPSETGPILCGQIFETALMAPRSLKIQISSVPISKILPSNSGLIEPMSHQGFSLSATISNSYFLKNLLIKYTITVLKSRTPTEVFYLKKIQQESCAGIVANYIKNTVCPAEFHIFKTEFSFHKFGPALDVSCCIFKRFPDKSHNG